MQLQSQGCSDVFVGYVFSFKGEPTGHRILVQCKHLRIYDANKGIFRYKKLNQLFQDIVQLVTSDSTCTYVRLIPILPVAAP
jgi:hypothetical protein